MIIVGEWRVDPTHDFPRPAVVYARLENFGFALVEMSKRRLPHHFTIKSHIRVIKLKDLEIRFAPSHKRPVDHFLHVQLFALFY